MTICNMSIEGGARAGLIAPDDTTFAYVHGRRTPQGAAWDAAVERWRLPTDDEATFDKSITIDADALEPMVTYGTNPGMGIPITSRVPSPTSRPTRPAARSSARSSTWTCGPGRRSSARRSTSCSSARARTGGSATCGWPAEALKGRRVADGVRLMVTPGSDEVKREAERERIADIFKAAGADWRGPMLDVHRDERRSAAARAVRGEHVDRNFEGRQGKGGRTFLASPLTAAASAVSGVVSDPRTLPGIESLAAVGGR